MSLQNLCTVKKKRSTETAGISGLTKKKMQLPKTKTAKNILAYIGLFVVGGIDGLQNGFDYLQFFLRFFIIGAVIKAFDIICLDYILLTKTHFFKHYFPETEGCAGWQDFGYNRRQQIRQSVFVVIGSAAAVGIFTLIAM